MDDSRSVSDSCQTGVCVGNAFPCTNGASCTGGACVAPVCSGSVALTDPSVPWDVETSPLAVTTADLNRDGKLDLVLADQSSDEVSVVLNSGNGTFAAAVNYGVGSTPVSVMVADFNGDGHPDLALANNGDDTVSVLFNTGSGAFSAAVSHATGSVPQATFAANVDHLVGFSPVSVAGGDLNNDGFRDVVVANTADSNVSIVHGACLSL